MAALAVAALDRLPGPMDRLSRAFSTGVSSAPLERAATFEEAYRSHYRDVYRYVLVMSHQRDEADDIVGDVFKRAFEAWRDGRGPAGRALPWLLLIARRVLTDRWRRGRLIAWVSLGSSDDTARRGGAAIDRTADEREFWMWLDALSRSLPARQREVLLLRYQRDLTDAEIGEVLGLSESGVRSLAARAVAALRRHPELWS
jgi:RNA polymerase sigma-70 factor (ECF subfamily)